ncbi:adenylate/guanylate cyclase domain-containing protein [Roseofilum sp. BLCC_M154]|uniref:Adenylate/guanylate cyclase domain-containing protein n=1 Tax=Roseofilum acuticapitatum BLCC-M154 TaxID=3022444 RepID=A0ABT7AW55_9CYAN|nr:adenylate/guanylate cyclase domain-containing protein [Roseofilum acuticapitatum]MDJ1171149.1 adenylate/guanylate cyclase domain-containing protein [Roseofilum acuticapitatum BLCC-M154]
MWQTIKDWLWQQRGVWIATPSITFVVILLRLMGALQGGELALFDLYMRWRPLEPRDPRIVIVGIDEADVQAIGQAIIPDRIYANLLQKLIAMEPRAIGLDIYRDLPVEPGHQALVEVFENTNYLIGIQKAVGDDQRDRVDPPPALKAKNQVGANDLLPDADSKVRRALVSLDTPEGETIYGLPLYLALLYLQPEGIGPEVVGEKTWRLGKTVFAPIPANIGAYLGEAEGGYQLMLNYHGPSQSFETVSLMDVLQDRVPKDWAKDRIVLIGAVGESFQDLFPTPYTRTPSQRMAGVEIHANITSMILRSALEGRPLIKSWNEIGENLWILFWAWVGAVLTWRLRHSGGLNTSTIRKAIAPIATLPLLILTTYGAFLIGWWLPVVPSILSLVGSFVAITGYIARSAGDIRKTFGRYLSQEIVATLLEHPEGLKLGGERRKITILTSDLRGFTALSERLSPEEVIKILNFYLGYMADVITEYQGTIDEFMGDGILVLFGAPIPREDDAQRAIACAVAMQLAMKPVNVQMKEWGLSSLEMGVGINTGEVVVGNIGSEKRTKYGVVGSQVNLTYRIESYTTAGQILVSESTLIEAGPEVKINSEKQVTPKGVKTPITIYDIGGIAGQYQLYLPKEEEHFFPLPQAIPLQYALLEGKNISDRVNQGELIALSEKGATILINPEYADQIPSGLTNLKINFFKDEQPENREDVYAKVLDNPQSKDRFSIRFTSKPPPVEAKLKTLYQAIVKPS